MISKSIVATLGSIFLLASCTFGLQSTEYDVVLHPIDMKLNRELIKNESNGSIRYPLCIHSKRMKGEWGSRTNLRIVFLKKETFLIVSVFGCVEKGLRMNRGMSSVMTRVNIFLIEKYGLKKSIDHKFSTPNKGLFLRYMNFNIKEICPGLRVLPRTPFLIWEKKKSFELESKMSQKRIGEIISGSCKSFLKYQSGLSIFKKLKKFQDAKKRERYYKRLRKRLLERGKKII